MKTEAPVCPKADSVATSRPRRVQAYPVFGTHAQLADFLARAAWHFAHVPDFELCVPLARGVSRPRRLEAPAGFDPAVQKALDAYLPRVHFQIDQGLAEGDDLLADADVVLKWVEGNSRIDRVIRASGKRVYRVDPVKVRQEGSYFIQCAFDLYTAKEQMVEECRRKFLSLADRIGQHDRAWVLATGPSIESYADNDYNDSIVIACNSVVLNDDLMQVCKPSVLVFADPIFHFGVSGYAGRFREVIEQRLRESHIGIVVPFKYYPLMVAKFPEHRHRIIGVPFEKVAHFNFDVSRNFRVKTTANILTLLLLPLATTFAREVRITGCDGRPLEQDDYFWGHGNSVQINEKMENIRRVHPGFFDIDYNEYYFEHCHTLDNMLREGEDAGWRFAHQGPSHIPALRDRSPAALELPADRARDEAAAGRRGDARACIVIEQDGVGTTGHYVRWHRNLIAALGERFDRIDVLCNRKQDPAHYPRPARPTFTSFSWSVSRSELSYRPDYVERDFFQEYLAEMKMAVRELHMPLPRELSLYIYFGSVQILKAVELLRADLLKDGCDLKAFVCLFHESVILDPGQREPRFPANAGAVLYHAAAQKDAFRVACVTRELSDFVYARFGVSTETYTNPTPGLDDVEAEALTARMLAGGLGGAPKSKHTILFPTAVREEKGARLISEFVRHLARDGVPDGHRYMLRGDPPRGLTLPPGLEFIGEDISDEAYWKNLRNSDVIVVPYLAPCFTYRTSGILADVLMSGTPSVVVAGTWLASVVDELGAGLVMEHRGPLSIASAVRVLLANQDAVRQRLRASAARYLIQNNWRATADFAAT